MLGRIKQDAKVIEFDVFQERAGMVQRFVGELPGAFKIGAQVFSFDGFQIQTEGQIIVIAPFAPGRQQADAHAQIPDGALIGGSVFGLASGHEVEFGDPEFFLVLFDVLEPCIEQLGYIKAVFGDVRRFHLREAQPAQRQREHFPTFLWAAGRNRLAESDYA